MLRKIYYENKVINRNMASEIITEFKKKGKEALNKVSEFFGVKKKLEKIRDKVREGIVDTDITLARIDEFTIWLISRLQIALECLQVKTKKIILRRFSELIILCFVSLGHGRRECIRT